MCRHPVPSWSSCLSPSAFPLLIIIILILSTPVSQFHTSWDHPFLTNWVITRGGPSPPLLLRQSSRVAPRDPWRHPPKKIPFRLSDYFPCLSTTKSLTKRAIEKVYNTVSSLGGSAPPSTDRFRCRAIWSLFLPSLPGFVSLIVS